MHIKGIETESGLGGFDAGENQPSSILSAKQISLGMKKNPSCVFVHRMLSDDVKNGWGSPEHLLFFSLFPLSN